MIREMTTLIERHLRHPTHGVVAMLAQVPRLPNDPDPVARGVLHVVSGYSDAEVAKDKWPKAGVPAIVVELSSPRIGGDARSGQRADHVDVSLNYVDETADPLKALALGSLMMRALRNSLNVLMQLPQEERVILGVKLIGVRSMLETPFPGNMTGTTAITGALVGVLDVFDLVPTP